MKAESGTVIRTGDLCRADGWTPVLPWPLKNSMEDMWDSLEQLDIGDYFIFIRDGTSVERALIGGHLRELS